MITAGVSLEALVSQVGRALGEARGPFGQDPAPGYYTPELVRVADIQLAAGHVPRRLRPQSIPWPYTLRGMPPNLARRRRRIRPINPQCSVTV